MAVKEVKDMKRKSIAMLAAALCTLAITVTALAAELINAEQARSIAAQWVPAGSTHLVTKDESFEFVPHYDVKFYDNKISIYKGLNSNLNLALSVLVLGFMNK